MKAGSCIANYAFKIFAVITLYGCDCTLTWFQSPGLDKALHCDVFSDMPGGFKGVGVF